MHVLGATEFLATLALSVTSTTLVSRFLYLLLRRWHVGIRKLPIVNGASFVLCWILFVVWCSTATNIYWFAGHVIVIPQIGWFIFDVLRYDGDAIDEVEDWMESETRAD